MLLLKITRSQYLEGLSLLIKELEPHFQKSKIVQRFMSANDEQLTKIDNKFNHMQLQLDIDTVTSEIHRYEKEYGIPVDPDKSLLERRAIVKAKDAGFGTSTKEQIRNVCLAFVDDVEVVEHPREMEVEINIILNGELPYTLDSMYRAVEEIQPCHIEIIYNLMTINNGKMSVGATNMTLENTTIFPQEVF